MRNNRLASIGFGWISIAILASCDRGPHEVLPPRNASLDVSGVVSSRHAEFVPGVEVELVRVRGPQGARFADTAIARTTTDERGRFRFNKRVPRGEWRVRAHRAQFADAEREIADGAQDVRLELGCLVGRIEGQVRFDVGIPPSELRVVVERNTDALDADELTRDVHELTLDDDRPARGAEEAAPGASESNRDRAAPFASTVLAADGRFAFDNVHLGLRRVRVLLAHDQVELARSEGIPVREGESSKLAPFDLRGKLAHVQMHFVDAQHQPVKGGWIVARRSGSPPDSPGVRCNFEHGDASITVPFVPFDLEVAADGLRTTRLARVAHAGEVTLLPSFSVAVVLDRPAALPSGVVVEVGLEPLSPAANSHTDAPRVVGLAGEIEVAAEPQSHTETAAPRACIRRTLPESGEARIEVAEAGTYRVRVRVTRPNAQTMELTEFEPHQIEVADSDSTQRLVLHLSDQLVENLR